MFICCSETIIDDKQIHQLFYPIEEKLSKGILDNFNSDTISYPIPKKRNNHFFTALLIFILYTTLVSYVTITIYRLKDKNNIYDPQYEARKDLIREELKNILCNLFFSNIRSSDFKNEDVALVACKRHHLYSYFKDFLQEYFNIENQIENLRTSSLNKSSKRNSKDDPANKEIICIKIKENLEKFYWPIEKINDIIGFFTISSGEKYNLNIGEVLDIDKVMETLIPSSSPELEHSSIESIFPFKSFQDLIHPREVPFEVSESIAKKLVLNSNFKEVTFKRGINERGEFLLFLHGLVKIDQEYVKMITNSIG
jgi:hypothetical protein